MTTPDWFSFRSGIDEYEREARELDTALHNGDERARWKFKWMHSRFRGRMVSEVKPETLDLDDARQVVAGEHSFDNWDDLAAFADAVKSDGPVTRFEETVEAVVSGDVDTLRRMLSDDPGLVRARSARRHGATLLHYVGANGVEGYRQRTPPNAVEVAKVLLEAGAEPDAPADMYETKCTTMGLLVSSAHPAEAGLQGALADTLLDHGAALQGQGYNWQSDLTTALTFGYMETAEIFARRGAAIDLPAAAGLGRTADVERLLPHADSRSRHIALGLAAQLGHVDVVRLLLDAGEDPNRYNAEGFHSHATPLHHAVSGNRFEVVKLLLDRGARLDTRDTVYDATPLGWAIYNERPEIADYLRSRGAT